VFERWLVVPDRIPGGTVDAVFCPTYSLNHRGDRLTTMARLCVELGLSLLREGRSSNLILSVAKYGYEAELAIKTTLVKNAGLPTSRVHYLKEVGDTYDEVTKALAVLRSVGARTVVVIADRYHMKRALKSWWIVAPDLDLCNISFSTTRYERAYHQSALRSAEVGFKPFWILWNAFFFHLTPLLMWVQARKR